MEVVIAPSTLQNIQCVNNIKALGGNHLQSTYNVTTLLDSCARTIYGLRLLLADESLFQTATSDSHHVLHHRVPVIKNQRYKLRPRTHSFTLTCKSSFHDNCNFITCMLFRCLLIVVNALLFVNCFNYMHC